MHASLCSFLACTWLLPMNTLLQVHAPYFVNDARLLHHEEESFTLERRIRRVGPLM